jgi:hypothetical protein
VVSIEKCTTPGPNENATVAAAAQLKQINPSIKVLFYWHVRQVSLACYASYFTYMAHPEWWLRDDSGAYINETQNIPILDPTIAAAREWWVSSVPLNSKTGVPAVLGIDGVLADGTGSRCPSSKLSASRCANYSVGLSMMVAELQLRLDNETPQGIVLGNGIEMYPNLPSNDYNMYTLADMGGIMGEHFAVFESVLPSGRLNVTRVALYLDAITTAAAQNKLVVFAAWPGPLVSPFGAKGFPSWPGGTQPTTYDQWRAALLANHTFALAGYLTVAAPTVFMQYQGW